jgi:hypothetical protein
MKSVAVIQSNYIPWKGYFDIIHDVDVFVFYDDVQFTKNDWRNRNKIKTPRGAEWISIPVGTDLRRLVCEVELTDASWQAKHWNLLRMHYESTPYFDTYRAFFEEALLGRRWSRLSELNHFLIRTIARDFLAINTEFVDSRTYAAEGQRQDRLIDLLKKVGAERYVSGPAASDYIDPALFASAGIELVYKSYAGYPPYPQRHPPFEHGVSVLDLLFNTGPGAPGFIWGWREDQGS